ncbi:MAG: CRTAC1 family protein [Phycisphaerales bacterium]|nr:CRTAC1 family protein [Phycisphaerales bacterium]
MGYKRVFGVVAIGVAGAICGCSREQTEAKTGDATVGAPFEKRVFVDVAVEAGITHRHHKPVLDHKLDNIMTWMASVGAAAAAADYDGDGWMDLYATESLKGEPNRLYRNNGDGTFTDVATAAGVADVNNDGGASMDCIWGDVDNDGDPDLFVVRWGYNVLFRNNGDGTFTDVTAERFKRRDGTPGTQWANGNAAIFWDFNLDGRLDIYVGNYFQEIDLWNLQSTRIMHDSFETARNAGANFLYQQSPDGTFEEVGAALGLDDPGWTLAVGSADVNNDGWPDLYCADDFGPDQLFISKGDGTFINSTKESIGLDTKKGMNVDFGDFNNDGWLDIYVTNITTAEYLQEGNMLWHNNGLGPDGVLTFTDIAIETNTYDGGWGWGAKFFDYENDGDLDLLALNGFISAGEGNYWYDLASWTVLGQDSADAANWPAIGNRSFSGYETERFWRNDGFDTFTLAGGKVGLDTDRDGRGLVCFDYDNDGDVDLYIANQDQPPHLYRNGGASGNHWLTVVLESEPSERVTRDATGTRVTLVTANGQQIRERDGGNGFSGQSDPRLHFGLGNAAEASLVEVRWPDGGMQYLEHVTADQFLKVRRDPAAYGGSALVKIQKPASRVPVTAEQKPAMPELPAAEIDALLSKMEAQIIDDASNRAQCAGYRKRCIQFNRHERSIVFFEGLTAGRPSDAWVRMELAAAYVDKIPTCGGIAAVVSKGTLARKSLDQMDIIIEQKGDWWPAYYARGINHLHWPRALRHSDDAAVDFEKCVSIQIREGAAKSKPYFERTYVLLGDSRAKNKEYDAARKAWRDGLKLFPESTELKKRLAIAADGEVLEFVEDARSLESPIDTDFTFLQGW